MADAGKIQEARSVSDMAPERAVSGKTKYIKGSDNMDWGMRNRLSRLIKEDGHCFFMPIDHGYFQGPTRCLERPGDTVCDLLEYADALFVTRGVGRSCIDPDGCAPR